MQFYSLAVHTKQSVLARSGPPFDTAPECCLSTNSPFCESARSLDYRGIRSVSCPHYFLHSALDKKLMLHGSGEYLPSISAQQDVLGSTRIIYWRSQRQTCGAVTLECSLPTSASFLVLAIRRAEYESNPDNSACLIIHRPIEATRAIRFRFSDGERMVVPTPSCMSLTQTRTHIYQLRWQRGCLEFLFDNQIAATDLEPWARTARPLCVLRLLTARPRISK